MKYYSRLERRNEKKAYMLMALGVIVLIVFVIFGFPAILNLTSLVGGLNRKTTTQVENGLIPTTPRFSQTLVATKSATIKIWGVADSEISVEIFQNGVSQGLVTAAEDGIFKLDVDLTRGANTFTAVALSETGEKSATSSPYEISYLNSPPKLEAEVSQEGVVKGKTDPGTQITVNDRFAIVSGDGSFSYQLNLSDGENKIKVVATDPAGNRTEKELKVTK